MQVIRNGVIVDYYISKDLPDNPSMKLLNHQLEFAERLVRDREKYIEQQRSWLRINESELNRVKDAKMRKRIEKCIEEEKDAIKRALRILEVEKEDLEALMDIIEIETFMKS